MTGTQGMNTDNKIDRQNTMRKLILGKTPTWLLFDALRKHVVKDGDKTYQPYKYVSDRTLERDLQEIKEEDRVFINKMIGDEWNYQLRQAVEVIENDQRELFKLAQDGGSSVKDKIDALSRHSELETMRLSLVMFGKTALLTGEQRGKELSTSKQSVPPVTV